MVKKDWPAPELIQDRLSLFAATVPQCHLFETFDTLDDVRTLPVKHNQGHTNTGNQD